MVSRFRRTDGRTDRRPSAFALAGSLSLPSSSPDSPVRSFVRSLELWEFSFSQAPFPPSLSVFHLLLLSLSLFLSREPAGLSLCRRRRRRSSWRRQQSRKAVYTGTELYRSQKSAQRHFLEHPILKEIVAAFKDALRKLASLLPSLFRRRRRRWSVGGFGPSRTNKQATSGGSLSLPPSLPPSLVFLPSPPLPSWSLSPSSLPSLSRIFHFLA